MSSLASPSLEEDQLELREWGELRGSDSALVPKSLCALPRSLDFVPEVVGSFEGF